MKTGTERGGFNERGDWQYSQVQLPFKGCMLKCCRWAGTRLEREYESEINSRLDLFGFMRWGRLRALVMGWAVAKGQDPDEAKSFARHICHH